jgi:hypothetical protein
MPGSRFFPEAAEPNRHLFFDQIVNIDYTSLTILPFLLLEQGGAF